MITHFAKQIDAVNLVKTFGRIVHGTGDITVEVPEWLAVLLESALDSPTRGDYTAF